MKISRVFSTNVYQREETTASGYKTRHFDNRECRRGDGDGYECVLRRLQKLLQGQKDREPSELTERGYSKSAGNKRLISPEENCRGKHLRFNDTNLHMLFSTRQTNNSDSKQDGKQGVNDGQLNSAK